MLNLSTMSFLGQPESTIRRCLATAAFLTLTLLCACQDAPSLGSKYDTGQDLGLDAAVEALDGATLDAGRDTGIAPDGADKDALVDTDAPLDDAVDVAELVDADAETMPDADPGPEVTDGEVLDEIEPDVSLLRDVHARLGV